MRHIISFKIFEGFTPPEQQELKDFCDEYLVHLYDRGFKVGFTTAPRARNNEEIDVNRMFITITANEVQNPDLKNTHKEFLFSWMKIRDFIIPFVDILNDNYVLGNFGTSGRRNVDDVSIRLDLLSKEHFYTASEIIETGHRLRHNLKSIVIMVMGKKE